MKIEVLPAKNSKTLWSLVVDGETWDEGTCEEMQEAANDLRRAYNR